MCNAAAPSVSKIFLSIHSANNQIEEFINTLIEQETVSDLLCPAILYIHIPSDKNTTLLVLLRSEQKLVHR